MSEEAMTLWQKLLEVQRAVKYMQQDGRQTYGEKFGYVSSAQALAAVRAKMDELGLLLTCSVVRHVLHVEGAYTHKSTKQHLTEITFEFTWVNVDNPTETAAYEWYGQGIDTGEKGVGKAATYAEKYFLLKFFHVATGKDDPDAFASDYMPEEEAPAPAPAPDRDEKGRPLTERGLLALLEECNISKSFVPRAAKQLDMDIATIGSWATVDLQRVAKRAIDLYQAEQAEAEEAATS